MKRKRPKRRRRGITLAFMVLFIVLMTAMVAFAADCGMIALARTQLQAAADAAALAGADALSSGTSAAQTAAQTVAQANKAGGASVSVVAASDIELGTWNSSTSTFTALSGAALSNASAVQVTTRLSSSRGTGLALFFARIFGISSLDLSATAVAKSGTSCGFVGLNSVTITGGSYTDSYNSSSGSYSAGSAGKHGNVCSNASIALSGGSYINGDAHPGSSGTVSGGTVSGSTSKLTTSLSEPSINFSSPSASNNNANIPKSHSNKTALNAGTKAFSLSGGDYLTLPAGTYYFSTFTLTGGAYINVTAATKIYCTGNVSASGGSIVNTTTIPSNLQLYCGGSTCVLSGSSQFYGYVYAPTADVTRSGGNSDLWGSIIGKSLTLSGGGGLHSDQAISQSGSSGQLVK